MEFIQKDGAVATVINTLLMVLGTCAALAYYLSLSAYASTAGFTVFISGDIGFLSLMYYYYSRRRYKDVR